MTRTEKDQLIDELVQVLAEKNVVYLTDASGLDSEATTSLRRECYKKDITVRVVKNTLLRKAMERTEDRNYTELYEVLKGQTALLFGDVGNAPALVLKEFRKKHDMPILKGAYVEEATYLGDENSRGTDQHQIEGRIGGRSNCSAPVSNEERCWRIELRWQHPFWSGQGAARTRLSLTSSSIRTRTIQSKHYG